MPGSFSRIVCGVDGSPASLEGLRQALTLRGPDAELLALVVCDLALAAQSGFHATTAADLLEGQAAAARDQAAEMLGGLPLAAVEVVRGRPVAALTAALERRDADLLVVGSHGIGRTAAILFGSVASELLHSGRWTTLVARPSAGSGPWAPATIAVGTDGSEHARAALTVARELTERFGSTLHVIASSGGKPVDIDGLARVDGITWDERPPVDALVAASAAADLVVVGSRGLHGLSGLGSVSERVAHRGGCSVLVVHRSVATRC